MLGQDKKVAVDACLPYDNFSLPSGKSFHSVIPESACEMQWDVQQVHYHVLHQMTSMLQKLHWIVCISFHSSCAFNKSVMQSMTETCTGKLYLHSCSTSFLHCHILSGLSLSKLFLNQLWSCGFKRLLIRVFLPKAYFWGFAIAMWIDLTFGYRSINFTFIKFISSWLIMENLLITPGTALSFLIRSASLTISVTKVSKDYPPCFSIN